MNETRNLPLKDLLSKNFSASFIICHRLRLNRYLVIALSYSVASRNVKKFGLEADVEGREGGRDRVFRCFFQLGTRFLPLRLDLEPNVPRSPLSRPTRSLQARHIRRTEARRRARISRRHFRRGKMIDALRERERARERGRDTREREYSGKNRI